MMLIRMVRNSRTPRSESSQGAREHYLDIDKPSTSCPSRRIPLWNVAFSTSIDNGHSMKQRANINDRGPLIHTAFFARFGHIFGLDGHFDPALGPRGRTEVALGCVFISLSFIIIRGGRGSGDTICWVFRDQPATSQVSNEEPGYEWACGSRGVELSSYSFGDIMAWESLLVAYR